MRPPVLAYLHLTLALPMSLAQMFKESLQRRWGAEWFLGDVGCFFFLFFIATICGHILFGCVFGDPSKYYTAKVEVNEECDVEEEFDVEKGLESDAGGDGDRGPNKSQGGGARVGEQTPLKIPGETEGRYV